jgi:hypothetical protein
MTLSSAAGKGTTLTFIVPLEATGREIRVTSATSTKLRVATNQA